MFSDGNLLIMCYLPRFCACTRSWLLVVRFDLQVFPARIRSVQGRNLRHRELFFEMGMCVNVAIAFTVNPLQSVWNINNG